jgi:hypothetical protein
MLKRLGCSQPFSKHATDKPSHIYHVLDLTFCVRQHPFWPLLRYLSQGRTKLGAQASCLQRRAAGASRALR